MDFQQMLDESNRTVTRNIILIFCSVALTAAIFVLILLPSVLRMNLWAWLIVATSVADIIGCIKMLRWRRAYRLLMPKHMPTELARGRIHQGAARFQLAAIAVFTLIIATAP